ncbi:MAG: hypothetical protein ACOCRU_01150 [bacterium]
MGPFVNELDYFIKHIDSMKKTLPLVMSLGDIVIEGVEKKYDEFMNSEYVTILEKDENRRRFTISPEKVKEYDRISSELESLSTAFNFMPKSIIVSLVSIYDAHVGNLIENMFEVKPELLNSLNKDVSFTDVLKASSINDLKEDIIAKEINIVLRKSHLEQIEWFEKKLGITLRSNKELIGKFVEITERRNLFVHSDGKVSNHYLNICKQNNYKFKKEPNVGDKLDVETNYFYDTVNCLLEIGIKLTHIIWRKLSPTQISLADENYTSITYDLIESDNYELAISLLEFILDSNQYDADYELIYLINLSQSYKWSGHEDKCKELIMSRNNWSLYKEKYQIAKHVLLGEYEEVYCLFRKYSDDDNVITKQWIREWPLFKEIRDDEEFNSIFEEVYEEPLILNERNQDKEIIERNIADKEVAATDCI